MIGGVAGFAVVAAALAWFLRARRRASHVGDTSGMPPEPGASLPHAFAHEPQELDAGRAMQELPDTDIRKPRELSSWNKAQPLVDERAAAGYEGAYRGH